MEYIEIPNAVTTLGNRAFAENKMKTISLREGLKSIGVEAFRNNNLINVTLPSSVETIGDRAFENNSISELTLQDGVKEIGAASFRSNELKRLVIPDSVIKLGAGVFRDNSIRTVTMSDGLDLIPPTLFQNNELEEVVFPDTIRSIGTGAFQNNKLKKVVIPESVTHINDASFRNNKLTDVVVPSAVQEVGEYAFYDNNLNSITFLNKETIIKSRAIGSMGLTSDIIGYYPSTAYNYSTTAKFRFIDINTLKQVSSEVNARLNPGKLILSSDFQLESHLKLSLERDTALRFDSLGRINYDVYDNRGVKEPYTVSMKISEFHRVGDPSIILPFTEMVYSKGDANHKTLYGSGTDVLYVGDPSSNPHHSDFLSFDSLLFENDRFIQAGEYEATITLEVISGATP